MDENEPQSQPQEAMAEGGDKPRAGREMLIQLQQMIDTLATQAGPVMREVAAKAAELAAVAGEKAGPLAHKAAGMTEQVGHRVAVRSKEVAANLRLPRTEESGSGPKSDTDLGDSDSSELTSEGSAPES